MKATGHFLGDLGGSYAYLTFLDSLSWDSGTCQHHSQLYFFVVVVCLFIILKYICAGFQIQLLMFAWQALY